MEHVSYITLQQKYPGQLVAVSEKNGKVVAIGKTVKELEKQLQQKHIDPETCTFIGPIERAKQISAY